MAKYIIDLETKGFVCTARHVYKRLGNLKSTILVEYPEVYIQDPDFSLVRLETDWTEEQLEEWLYKTKDVEYIGIVKVD